jgi:hypothetical protein
LSWESARYNARTFASPVRFGADSATEPFLWPRCYCQKRHVQIDCMSNTQGRPAFDLS